MRLLVLQQVSFLTISLLRAAVVVLAQNNNLDQFTYQDNGRTSPNNVYAPEDWGKVRCANLDQCLGWPDGFEAGVEWKLDSNSCRWCPKDRRNCGTHHQSPINLQRNRALEGSNDHNPCIDVHWMSYHDSTCTFDGLVNANAFSIERHALKMVQPLHHVGGNKYIIDCQSDGRRWGRIDFSKGFSQWWHLSHMDLHVPSEHTQEGKRYDGEIHLYHFYSVSAQEAGIENEMASVTFFLQAYPDQPDYDFLNRVICQWRKVEEYNRRQCRLPSVQTEYPGCYYYTRGFTVPKPAEPEEEEEEEEATNNTTDIVPPDLEDNTTDIVPPDLGEDNTTDTASTTQSTADATGFRGIRGRGRRLRRRRKLSPLEQAAEDEMNNHARFRKKPLSAHDVILHNLMHGHTVDSNHTDGRPPKKTIQMSDADFEPEDPNFDWEAFIAEQYAQEEARKHAHDQHGRKLLDYSHVGPWFNYFPLIGVKTEYYYRYSGTQTVPPCYGRFTPGSNRGNTNHWRVMKDPIRISQRQLDELHRLIKSRIAPPDDPLRACQPDTAAKKDPHDANNRISVARPLQSNHYAHFKVFCECANWGSKWEEDREWCRMEKNERFYDQPYNFKTNGF